MLEDLNFELLAKIDRCLKKTSPPTSLSLLDISNQGSTYRATQIQDVKIKLPKLEMSKFDGDIINWQGFWDQFLIAIHENDYLVDKFSYVKSFLLDFALQSINGLSLNATIQLHSTKSELRFCAGSNLACGVLNIREGEDLWQWSQLEIRGDTFRRSTIPQNNSSSSSSSSHMKKLEKLPKIKSSNDINVLRKMYDRIEVCVRSWKALNIDIATYGAILVPFLNGKLPSEIRVILSRNFQNDIWQLDISSKKVLKFWKGRSRHSTLFKWKATLGNQSDSI